MLNRPSAVQISKTSGLAGIAYWMNQNYALTGDDVVGKRDEIVIRMKDWVDQMYEDGRQTVLTNTDLESQIELLAPGKYHAV